MRFERHQRVVVLLHGGGRDTEHDAVVLAESHNGVQVRLDGATDAMWVTSNRVRLRASDGSLVKARHRKAGAREETAPTDPAPPAPAAPEGPVAADDTAPGILARLTAAGIDPAAFYATLGAELAADTARREREADAEVEAARREIGVAEELLRDAREGVVAARAALAVAEKAASTAAALHSAACDAAEAAIAKRAALARPQS